MNLMDVKPDRGFYKISITAASVTNSVTVKVLSETLLDYLEIGTGDADQTTQPKLTKYLHNNIFYNFRLRFYLFIKRNILFYSSNNDFVFQDKYRIPFG